MISRETDYAFRVIRALLLMERMSLQQICDAEYVPEAYAYKILKKLERARLVTIFRGVRGGYELCRDWEEKTFYDVYHAIEGELFLGACQVPGSMCPHRQGQAPCGIHRAMNEMQAAFVAAMKARPLRSALNA